MDKYLIKKNLSSVNVSKQSEEHPCCSKSVPVPEKSPVRIYYTYIKYYLLYYIENNNIINLKS